MSCRGGHRAAYREGLRPAPRTGAWDHPSPWEGAHLAGQGFGLQSCTGLGLGTRQHSEGGRGTGWPWSSLTHRIASGTHPRPQVTGHGAEARVSHLEQEGQALSLCRRWHPGRHASLPQGPGLLPPPTPQPPPHSLYPHSPSRARGSPTGFPPTRRLASQVTELFLDRGPQDRVHAHETQLPQACGEEAETPSPKRRVRQELRVSRSLESSRRSNSCLCHLPAG